ncbi:S8 family serine peptidase [Novosphingobium malaysiense]|uniref:Peptidase S8 n=1 Tax=Novosphingobium malaysiense TaxID=1348853 RepID=A0A0B1ZQ18_9SPHN|nr:S8 family serine peptidase [Novosphingobium malaysiense]KHK93215.1 peptidase S8 [Novosphingobium malaysiense]
MDRRTSTGLTIAAALMMLAAGPVNAQLGGALPSAPLPVDPLGTVGKVRDAVGEVTETALDPVEEAASGARTLARKRLQRIAHYVSDHQDVVAWDERHQPAVRGVVLLLDPDQMALDVARREGYSVLEQGEIDGLDTRYARLAVPEAMSLAKSVKRLRKALPGHDVSADQLYFPSGRTVAVGTAAAASSGALPRGGTVGVIDGGISGSDLLAGQRGFAKGAPHRSDHASAIASLLAGAGTARVYGADVYGTDPAGGNALAIAKALGWMRTQGVPVVSISLVGPANPLLGRAISAARTRGMVVVAAVGNDGAAAPPAYPASYPGVVAVTGVDGAGRVLIEAGRASHLDYAAPGADMSAIVPGKGRIDLRGTSFAAPLAASRIAARLTSGTRASQALKAVDSEAVDASRRTGRGIVCDICRSGL